METQFRHPHAPSTAWAWMSVSNCPMARGVDHRLRHTKLPTARRQRLVNTLGTRTIPLHLHLRPHHLYSGLSPLQVLYTRIQPSLTYMLAPVAHHPPDPRLTIGLDLSLNLDQNLRPVRRDNDL